MSSGVLPVRSTFSARTPAVWVNVSAWLLLMPIIFNCLRGSLELDGGNIKLRYTAMQGDSTMHRLEILSFILSMAWLGLKHSRKLGSLVRKYKFLIVLPALALASSLWSGNRSHAFLEAVSLLMQTVLAMYICVFLRGKRLIEMIVFTGFIALTLSSLSLFIHGVGIDVYQQNAWRGIFGQRNNCGAACVWFVLSAAHYRPTNITAKFVKSTVYLLGAVFLVMAGSRTAWELCLVAIILCYLATMCSRYSKLDSVIILSTAVPACAVAGLFVYLNSGEILHAIGKDPTLNGRSILWAVALQAFTHHPWLGYGYASFWNGTSGESANAVLTTGWMEGQAQNGFIDLLLQLGLVGLGAFILMTVVAFRKGISAIRRNNVDFLHARWSCVMIILILLFNIGESAIATAFDITWLLYLIALIGCTVSTLPEQAPRIQRPGRSQVQPSAVLSTT